MSAPKQHNQIHWLTIYEEGLQGCSKGKDDALRSTTSDRFGKKFVDMRSGSKRGVESPQRPPHCPHGIITYTNRRPASQLHRDCVPRLLLVFFQMVVLARRRPRDLEISREAYARCTFKRYALGTGIMNKLHRLIDTKMTSQKRACKQYRIGKSRIRQETKIIRL